MKKLLCVVLAMLTSVLAIVTLSAGCKDGDHIASKESIVQVKELGSVSGSIMYNIGYNGKVEYPDTGAIVQIIPEDIKSIPSNYTYLDEMEEYGIYRTKVDGNGGYIIENVPVGTYRIIVFSNHARLTSTVTLKYLNDFESRIEIMYGEKLYPLFTGNEGLYKLKNIICPIMTTQKTITIEKERTRNFSTVLSDFGIY